jgi:gliding motility-associated-like protein
MTTAFTFLVTVEGFSAGNIWQTNIGIQGTYLTPTLFGPYPIIGGPILFVINDAMVGNCILDMWANEVPPTCSSCQDTMDAGNGSLLNCKDTLAILTGSSTATGNYHWTGPSSFSSDSLSCIVQDSGWYQLSIDFGKQCISIDCVYVAQNLEAPVANAGLDQQLDCLHSDVTLNASSSSGNNFTLQWTNESGLLLSSQSIVVTDTAGLYVLQLTNTQTGCSSLDTALVTINQNELGIINFMIIDENCIGEENGVIEVMNIEGGMPPFNFSLNGNPNTTGIFDHLAPGDYQLHISDVAGCSLDTMITINEGIDLEVELPETIILTENEGGSIEAQVNVPISSLSTIQWSPPGVLSCDSCLSTTIYTNVPQTLTITVTHWNGCMATAQVDIFVVPSPDIYIPNSFSPNDDGINDQFTLFTNDGVTSILEMNIYDRWGEHVFHTKDISPNEPARGWDGKFHQEKMPAGVYVYTMEVRIADGSERSLKGNITLIR